jgi:hypothetical protein
MSTYEITQQTKQKNNCCTSINESIVAHSNALKIIFSVVLMLSIFMLTPIFASADSGSSSGCAAPSTLTLVEATSVTQDGHIYYFEPVSDASFAIGTLIIVMDGERRPIFANTTTTYMCGLTIKSDRLYTDNITKTADIKIDSVPIEGTYLRAWHPITFNGKIVKLEKIDQGTALFNVNNNLGTARVGQSVTLDSVIITPHSTFDAAGYENDSTTVDLVMDNSTHNDFSMSAIYYDPASPKEGTYTTVFATFKYTGDPIAYTYVDIFVDNSSIAHTTAFNILNGNIYTVSGAPNKYAPGKHTVEVIVDPQNDYAETDEANNKMTSSFTVTAADKPDLTVSEIRPSHYYPTDGTEGSILVLYKNTNNPTSGQFEADVFIDGVFYRRSTVASLANQGSVWDSFPYTYRTGNHTIKIVADSSNQIDESNENNNILTYTYEIKPIVKKPDFMVQSIILYGPNNEIGYKPREGETVKINFTFKNVGNDAGQLWYSTTIEAPQNYATAAARAATAAINPRYLQPGEAYSTVIEYTVQGAGYYTAKAVIDPNHVVDEINEDNNEAMMYFYTINGTNLLPDFIVDSIVIAPSTPTAGDNATISVTFRNIGRATAELWYAVNLDKPIKYVTAASQAETSQHRTLAPQETYTTVITTNLYDPGYYTLRAVIDPDNKVVEQNENNNQESRSFYVTPTDTSTIQVYLDQIFTLQTGQSATVNDYKNLRIKLTSVNSNTATFALENIPTKNGKIILHRNHLNCKDDSAVKTAPNGGLNQIFEVGYGTGYWNFECKNRKQEQCYDDGSFDTYYDEWCEYPVVDQPVTSKTFTVKIGESTSVDGVMLKLLNTNVDSNEAKLVISKNEIKDSVDIGIEPRSATVYAGDVAEYTLVITDNHLASGTYTYKLSAFGLPYRSNLPESIVLSSKETRKITFEVYTNDSITYITPLPITTEQVSITVNKAGNYNQGHGGNNGVQDNNDRIVFDNIGQAQEYCLNNAEDTKEYNQCIKKIVVKTASKQTQGSDTNLNSPYRFAIRAYSTDTSDVAYASLYVQKNIENPPEFPTDTVTVKLDKGWNLVSLGGNKVVKFQNNQCGSQKLISFVYMQNDQKYVSLVKAMNLLGNDFTDFISRHAFWVYSYKDCSLEVQVEKDVSYRDLSMDNKWNLLPITQDMIGKSFDTLDHNCNIQKIYMWNSDSQQWKAISESYIFQQSDQYSGMIVKTDNYCQMGNTRIDNPPEFPNQ